jgi:hypothetical protein
MMLTQHQMLAIRDTLTSSPFECDRVFFFDITAEQPVPMDEESAEMQRKYGAILEELRQQPMSEYGRPGNLVTGPRENADVRFFAGCPLGGLLFVLRRTVQVTDAGRGAMSPFNLRFLDAVAASVLLIVGEAPAAAAPGVGKPDAKIVTFEELRHWRDCRVLWRRRYGPERWLAVKGSQVVADAASSAELDRQIAGKQIPPPVLYVPPEGQEAGGEVCSDWGPPTRVPHEAARGRKS